MKKGDEKKFKQSADGSYKRFKAGKSKRPMSPREDRIRRYIKYKLSGMSKNQSARLAGYGDEYAKSPYRIEGRKTYNIIFEEISADITSGMNIMAESLKERINDGEASKLKLLEHIDGLDKLSKIAERMMPKVSVTQDKDGNVTKKSIWGSVGANNNGENQTGEIIDEQ